jgi:hypothetical protein
VKEKHAWVDKSQEYVRPDHGRTAMFPSWNVHLTALPLLAEFCSRHGQFQLLLGVLNKVQFPNANVVVMWRQLQETIPWNFNVFSEN